MLALRLLRTHRPFRRLWTAGAISLTGDVIATTALVLHIEQVSQSPVLVGVLILSQGAPNVLGPLLGAVADRVDRRRLMLGVEAAQVAVFALLAVLLPPVTMILVLVALSGFLAAAFRPANRSATADLVPAESIAIANSLAGSAASVALAAGPAIGALAFAELGVRATLALNAATFGISLVLLIGLPTLDPPGNHNRAEKGQRRLLTDVVEGVRALRDVPVLRIAIPATTAAILFASVDNVANVFLVRDALDQGAAAYGLLTTTLGVGMIGGTTSIGLMASRTSTVKIFSTNIAVAALGLAMLAVAPSLSLALLGAIVAGFANGVALVVDDILLMEHAPPHLRGRIFGLAGGAQMFGYMVASAAAGPLVAAAGPRGALAIGAGGLLSAYAWTVAGFRSQGASAPPPKSVTDL
jgi:MFS family permease